MNRIILDDYERLNIEYKDVWQIMAGSSVLITGATGMITTYLAKFLIFLGAVYNITIYLQVRNADKAKKIFSEELENDNLKVLYFDFENNDIPDIKVDYIIHAASLASTKAFMEKPVEVISPNVMGTWNLLKWSKERDIKKFLFLSSNSIYGEGGISKTLISENDYGIVSPINSRACYIESKRIAEQMCMAFYKEYNVATSIIRICHCYGPTFDIEHDSRIIPRTIKTILSGKDIEIYSDKDSVVQYTYIADMVSAILLVLLCGKIGEVYNAGGDELISVEDAIGWMLSIEGNLKSKLLLKEKDDNYKFSKGNGINLIMLSNDKLKHIGWKQLYGNREGFQRTMRSYLEESTILK